MIFFGRGRVGCVLCEQDNLKQISTKDAKSGGLLSVSVCISCGMVQQDPVPTEEELKSYYSTEYRHDYKKTYTPKSKHIFRAGNLALKRIDFLRQGGVTQGRLLDIGAGGGEFTYLSEKLGFDAQGIEPNIGYSTYAREEYGINVQTGQLDSVTGSYQVITMFHVLEHMPDPIKAFKMLAGLLEENGHLLIEVPNIESKDASPHNIYFKAHIHYFSESTLIATASAYFDVIISEKGGNLRVLFRRKSKQVALQLPAKDQAQHTQKRLQSKGWLEYIASGKATNRLLDRIKVIIQDLLRPQQKGLVILKSLIKYK